ncbi:MAG: hypothetical protein L3J04_00255 [Robiginitomaculum sp.]|nr:hypothetical protein [Robiginitomaculum sp.]
MKKIRAILRKFYMLFAGEHERSDYIVQYAKYYWARLFGKKSYVRKTWNGTQDSTSKDVAVFVHFDANGTVHNFVLHYLGELNKAGRRVIFVTNSPKFPKSERKKLDGLVASILWRRNKGYDFGAYADGIKSLGDLHDLNSLLICNDSVYGPVFSLKDLFKKMPAEKADIWALTDSWDTRYHLQSYFLLFHKNAIRHKFFTKRWQNYVHVHSKSWVIRKHEIGLSMEARKAGLRARAVFRYRDQLARFFNKVGDANVLNDKSLSPSHRHVLGQIFEHAENSAPLNASHFFWDQLLLSGYPFIKREVLQGNPMRLPRLYKWQNLIEEITDYDTELINDHLEEVMRGRFI